MEVAHRDGVDLETLLLLILQEGPWAGMLSGRGGGAGAGGSEKNYLDLLNL